MAQNRSAHFWRSKGSSLEKPHLTIRRPFDGSVVASKCPLSLTTASTTRKAMSMPITRQSSAPSKCLKLATSFLRANSVNFTNSMRWLEECFSWGSTGSTKNSRPFSLTYNRGRNLINSLLRVCVQDRKACLHGRVFLSLGFWPEETRSANNAWQLPDKLRTAQFPVKTGTKQDSASSHTTRDTGLAQPRHSWSHFKLAWSKIQHLGKKIHGSVTVLDPETPWHIMAFLMAYKQRAAKGFNPTANSGIEKNVDLWSEKTPSTKGMQWTCQFKPDLWTT